MKTSWFWSATIAGLITFGLACNGADDQVLAGDMLSSDNLFGGSASSTQSEAAGAEEISGAPSMATGGIGTQTETHMDAAAMDQMLGGLQMDTPTGEAVTDSETKPSSVAEGYSAPTVVDLAELPRISFQPTVAIGGDGEVAMAWSGTVADDLGIWFAVLNADGTARFPPIAIDTTSAGIQNEPSVCELEGGGYVVAWSMDAQVQGPSGQNLFIRYRLIDSDGRPQGATDREVRSGNPGNHWLVDIACEPGGGFVVVGARSEVNDTFGIFAQRFDVLGQAQGDAIQVNPDIVGTQMYPSVGIRPDGTLLVAWEDQQALDTEMPLKRVLLRSITPGVSEPRGEVIQVSSPTQEASAPVLSVDPGSGTALLGVVLNQRQIGLYSISTNGNQASVLQSPMEPLSYGPALAPLGNDRHLFGYADGVGQNVGIKVGILQPGQAAINSVELARGAFPPYRVAVAAGRGRLAVAWTERTHDGGMRVRLATFNSR